ncbi:MAG TPA: metal-dependent hydrolase [Candidatus Bathyarchaeia archaeon]|nr:metal-dependent hydrolase [Candidatus Bathyarchaeia archaeon]
MKFKRNDLYSVIKISLFYSAVSLAFSLSSVFLPDKTIVNQISPGALNVYEIAGHFLWGVVAAVVTLRLKYILLGGAFAVLIDSDHIINLLQTEGISRMSHSIAFAVIAVIIVMLVFGKRDYILGAIAGASVLSHISYDLFVDDYTGFPLFAPFNNISQHFAPTSWIYFEIMAIIIVGIITVLVRQKSLKEEKPSTER